MSLYVAQKYNGLVLRGRRNQENEFPHRETHEIGLNSWQFYSVC